MFPAGAAGYGLLILRLCSAGMLVFNALARSVALASWEVAVLVIVTAMLCFGLFTPLSSIAAGVAQIVMVFGTEPNPICFGLLNRLSAAGFLLLTGGNFLC